MKVISISQERLTSEIIHINRKITNSSKNSKTNEYFKQNFNSTIVESLCGENSFLPGIFQASRSEIPGMIAKKS